MADANSTEVARQCTNGGHGLAIVFCEDCEEYFCNACMSGHQNYKPLKDHRMKLVQNRQTNMITGHLKKRDEAKQSQASECVNKTVLQVREILNHNSRSFGISGHAKRELEHLNTVEPGSGNVADTEDVKCQIVGDMKHQIVGDIRPNNVQVLSLGEPVRMVKLPTMGKMSGMVVVGEMFCATYANRSKLWLQNMLSQESKEEDVPNLVNPQAMALMTADGHVEVAIIDREKSRNQFLHFSTIYEDLSTGNHTRDKLSERKQITSLSVGDVRGRNTLVCGLASATENSFGYFWPSEEAQFSGRFRLFPIHERLHRSYPPRCVLGTDDGYVALRNGTDGAAVIQWLNTEGDLVMRYSLSTGRNQTSTGMVQDDEGRLIVPGPDESLYVFEKTPEGPCRPTSYLTMNDGDTHCMYFDKTTKRLYIASGGDETELVLGYSWPPANATTSVPEILFCDFNAGMEKCGTQCKLCKYVRTAKDFHDPWGRRYNIVHDIHCHTRNVIYGIFCQKCDRIVYVGETERTLEERGKEHLEDVNNRTAESVPTHFQTDGHKVDDFQVMGIEKVALEDDSERKNKEKQWIRQLWTSDPEYGVNKTK